MMLVIGILIGLFLGVGLMVAGNLASVRLCPPTKLGNLNWKLMGMASKLWGLHKLYNGELRSLRVLELALQLCWAFEVPLYKVNTMIAYTASKDGPTLDELFPKLACSVVLAAHTRRIDLGAAVVQELERMEQ